jgi:Domain of unknown function (DUF4440)
MKKYRVLFVWLMMGILLINPARAQQPNDKDEILSLRNAYNVALKEFDAKHFTFLTDDSQTTTGTGTLIQGKENLREYLSKASGPKMYWVRTPNEIDVNVDQGLAWEAGVWKGYTTDSAEKSVTGGKYSAMWVKINGDWKIKSQLFVKLE